MSKDNKTAATLPRLTDATPSSALHTPAAAEDFGPMQEFQTGFVRPDGFWQKQQPGQKLKGILVGERRTSAGSSLKSPYYIFELTEDFPGMTVRKDDTKPGTEDNQKIVMGKRGQKVGLRASYDLNGSMRKLGHYFELEYLGEVPAGPGKTVKKFKKGVSARCIREIEKFDVEGKVAEGGEDVAHSADPIPF